MKVYMSSTRTDLAAYRRMARKIIESGGHTLLQPSADSTLNARYAMIEEAHVFVGIYAHRYGDIPKGESRSIVELEHKRAVAEGKDLLLYILDATHDWPESHKEDDFIKRERLHSFLAKLQKQRSPVIFTSEQQVKTHLQKELAQLSEKHDRMQKLREWSAGLPPDRKFSQVEQLAQAYNAGKISERPYFTATRIITSHFAVKQDGHNRRIIDESEQLLMGNRTFEEYLKSINASSPLEKLDSLMKKHTRLLLILTGLVFLILGLWLGDSLSNSKLPTAEQSAMLSPAASIQHGRATPDSAISDADSSDKQREAPLLPVRESDPLDSVLKTETTAGNSVSMSPAAVSSAPATISSAPPSGIATDDPEIEKPARTTILKSPDPAVAKVQKSIASDSVKPHPMVAKLFREIPKDTLSIEQYLDKWKAAADTLQAPGAQTEFSRTIARLKQHQRTRSQLTSPKNFVMCANVNTDTRRPEGISDTLNTGKVWVWAQVQTSRADTIRAEWIVNDRLFHTSTATISSASGAYRVFFSKWHDVAQIGRNELRLKDGQDFLIARKTYWVTR